MAAKKSVRHTTRTQKPRARSATKARAGTQRLLAAGTKAPAFTLKSTPDQTVSLSDFRGRPVILAFYPADWSPTCGDQLALYNEVLPEFQRYNAELIGISVDGAWCHAAYAKARNLHFPLLADFEPKGAVAKAYGAYVPSAGMSGRALFVLDGKGTIRWSYLSAMDVNPGADGILSVLESLGTGTRATQLAAQPAVAKHRAGAPSVRPAVRTEVREAR
ncbi:MAG: redoxin domain-containing protein [Gemmatimonadales bacterium]